MTNRLQFSEIISDLTDEEVTWFVKYIEHRHRKLDIEGDEHEFEDDGYPAFKFKIMASAGEWKTYAWFFADEVGDVAQVAETVQAFLKEHRPHQCFTLTWAESNSSLTPGEFDGGAVFVTAEEIEMFHGVEWARGKEKEFNAA